MSTLSALTLRFACDQSNRAEMSPVNGVDSDHIYLGNPVFVQIALFSGVPSDSTFIDTLTNITRASLVLRRVNAQGEIFCQKDIETSSAGAPHFNGALTYGQWLAAISQHFQFDLSVLDTNTPIPSCGRLEFYAGIALETGSGPIFVGFFKGFLIDDGVAVWLLGVTATGAPVLFFRLVDSYIGLPTSLDRINGSLLGNGDIVKVVINGSNSEWQVFKPATKVTSVDEGIIRLANGSAHLERTEGY